MIYIDEPTYYPYKPHGYHYWSHMWTDGDIEELHKFAVRIGLRRAWFQPHPTLPHYDVTGRPYQRALEHGAKIKSVLEYYREKRLFGL